MSSKHSVKSKSLHGAASDTPSINVVSATLSTRGPDVSKFKPEELAIFDADGFTRTFLTIKFDEVNNAVYDGMFSITRLQYALPVRYLKPNENAFSYVAQKSFVKDNLDMNSAIVLIEPLNAGFSETIPYTPINQHIPLDTPVTIDVSVPFETLPDGTEPDRRFVWSNCLKTDPNIEKIICDAYPKSIRTKPWQEFVHYGAMDIGSRLECKYVVALSDPKIFRSYNLYGFRFNHIAKELVIWTFKCFNLTPVEVLNMIHDHPDACEESKTLIEKILAKVK